MARKGARGPLTTERTSPPPGVPGRRPASPTWTHWPPVGPPPEAPEPPPWWCSGCRLYHPPPPGHLQALSDGPSLPFACGADFFYWRRRWRTRAPIRWGADRREEGA